MPPVPGELLRASSVRELLTHAADRTLFHVRMDVALPVTALHARGRAQRAERASTASR